MTKIILHFIVYSAVALFAGQTFAGAPTTAILVNGPGLPSHGAVIHETWPGGVWFIDQTSGPVSEPASDLPRYVLAGYVSDTGKFWYTLLYVWDHRSGRALVYAPGSSEVGYQINRTPGMPDELTGKWYLVSNRITPGWGGDPQRWADSIRKVLPQTSLGNK